jgi:DNA-binding response OmpR family regulator
MSAHIIFADKSVTIRKVVELAFENEDANVTTVENGEEVLTLLEEINPDIVIADMELSDMSGIDLCKKIKKSDKHSLIPVIIIKKNSVATDAFLLDPLGPDGFLVKPFKSEELVRKVSEFVGTNNGDTISSELTEKSDSFMESENDYGASSESGEFISLTPDKEISNEGPEDKDERTIVEITSAELAISPEEPNLSGLLTPEEILVGEESIKARNAELDEVFKADNDIDWDDEDGFAANSGKNVQMFFKDSGEKVTDTPPDFPLETILKEKISDPIKKKLEKAVLETNEKIVREEMRIFLEHLTPKIISSVEKVIWDIIPDLAESMLKKEIEKIKNG